MKFDQFNQPLLFDFRNKDYRQIPSMNKLLLAFILFFNVYCFGQFIDLDQYYQSSGDGNERIDFIKFDQEMNLVSGINVELWLGNDNYQKIFRIIKTDTLNNIIWRKEIRAKIYFPKMDCQISGMQLDANGNIYLSGRFNDTLTIDKEDILSASTNNDDFLMKISHDGEFLWARSYANEGEYMNVANIAINEGNLYYTGIFRDSIIVGEDTLISRGEEDCFLLKLDLDGEVLYARQFGSNNKDRISSISLREDKVFLTGHFEGEAYHGLDSISSAGSYDLFVCCYNTDGTHEWSKAGGGEGEDYGNSIKTSEDRVFILGTRFGNGNFGGIELHSDNESFEVYLVCLDFEGNYIWAKTTICDKNVYPRNLSVEDNSIYFTSFFSSRLGFESYDLNPSDGDVLFCELDLQGNLRTIQHGLNDSKAFDIKNGLIAIGGRTSGYYSKHHLYYNRYYGLIKKARIESIGEFPDEILSFPNPFLGELNLVNLGGINECFIFDSAQRLVHQEKNIKS